MGLILQLLGRVDGTPTAVDGQYVVNYDPTIVRGTYTLDTTDNRAKAKRFETASEAMEYVRRPCPNIPQDHPGHVNRPITAYHMAMESL